MPLVLVLVGIALLVAAVRGTLQTPQHNGLLDLIAHDFTDPQGSFLPWLLAVGLVGAVGYVKPLRPISNAFLVLLLIVFLLAANKGGRDFFTSLTNQVLNRSAAGPTLGGSGLGSNLSLSDPSLNLGLIGAFNPIGG